MELQELWQSVLGELELQISKPNFQTWLKNSFLSDKKDEMVSLSLESAFAKEWVSNKYHKIILKIIRNFDPEIKDIIYQIQPSEEKLKAPISSHIKKMEADILSKTLDFPNYSIDPKTGLNSKYTLQNFVVGANNELAYSAGLGVISELGKKYNPLFIYGGVGLGKTHLIQGVGNELRKLSKNRINIRYVSSETFTNEVINGIRMKRMDDLKNKYRKVDALIIDDIQFISGKEATQQEFFHTFNALYENNKQIIISSDRSPYLLSTLEERLRSRFEGGMVADISYPDHETRVAILKTKMDSQNKDIILSNDVFELISQKFPYNIRELEGALIRLLGMLKIRKLAPTAENAASILDEINNHRIRMISPDNIIATVVEFYNTTEKEILSHSRKKELVKPRQIIMYLLREDLKNSFSMIARKLGNRDHTTILHAYNKISKDIIRNKMLSQEINLIKEKIYNNN
ncbi:MAG TPA: chromosomal replication initiator protein DnaA [Candidatus Paceibacterota bacterium]|nr:chromosomal replication initiator protein DnaA [Candidatus Paceibacterota bacterium]HPT40171.1 chromosomal replication initiator protein DnaA [Candidatus Paceibacterota bacterium]